MIFRSFYILVLVTIIIASCNSSSKQLISSGLKRKWMLVSMGEFSRDTLIKYATYVDLSVSSKEGNAYMGCNNIVFNFQVSKENIKIFNVFSTEKYCLQSSNIENEFKRLVLIITRFSTKKAHKLELFDKTGKLQLEFIAADWD